MRDNGATGSARERRSAASTGKGSQPVALRLWRRGGSLLLSVSAAGLRLWLPSIRHEPHPYLFYIKEEERKGEAASFALWYQRWG